MGERMSLGRRKTTPEDEGAMGDPTTPSDADGVLVASVWRTGADERTVVRLTMTRTDDDGDRVVTVSTSGEALAHIAEWLAGLGV
jgi:hypothetical protein